MRRREGVKGRDGREERGKCERNRGRKRRGMREMRLYKLAFFRANIQTVQMCRGYTEVCRSV